MSTSVDLDTLETRLRNFNYPDVYDTFGLEDVEFLDVIRIELPKVFAELRKLRNTKT